MFHHVAPEDIAKAGNFASLNVTPSYLEQDLQYLQSRNFHAITPSELIHFFDGSGSLPSHPIMLTFDDGYADFAQYAAPLLSKYQTHATMFLPTGLMDNPPVYMTWSQVAEIDKQGYVYFGNHTWSHHSALGDLTTEQREIGTADTQLKDHSLNSDKVFAYPYGTPSSIDEQVLSGLGYNFAVTTTHGTWQCKGQKYTLPRIRIGNASLSQYGIR
jgi:peptidoglycan/xylan/chitin deacetylase (PgdA/CDA1 family)